MYPVEDLQKILCQVVTHIRTNSRVLITPIIFNIPETVLRF